MGLLNFLGAIGKIIEALPIQGRIERAKNKLENLKKEKGKLMNSPATKKSSKRVSEIQKEITKINQTLKNYAKD